MPSCKKQLCLRQWNLAKWTRTLVTQWFVIVERARMLVKQRFPRAEWARTLVKRRFVTKSIDFVRGFDLDLSFCTRFWSWCCKKTHVFATVRPGKVGADPDKKPICNRRVGTNAGKTTIFNSKLGADAGQTKVCNKKYGFCARFEPRVVFFDAFLKLVLQNTRVFTTVVPGQVGADAGKTTICNSRANADAGKTTISKSKVGADAGQTKVCNTKYRFCASCYVLE